jgi:hypothetical protein
MLNTNLMNVDVEVWTLTQVSKSLPWEIPQRVRQNSHFEPPEIEFWGLVIPRGVLKRASAYILCV